MQSLRVRLAAVIAVPLILYGCASAPASQAAASAQTNPLTGMIGRQLVVLPAQFLSTAGPAGEWDIIPQGPSVLPILDEEIADAFRKRGVRSNWTFAREITASADRNGGLAGNPRELSVQPIRRIQAGDTPLPEPLASQIRTLVALTNARYVVLPLELRLDVRGGQRKAALRVLLVDARTARVVWAGDVEGPQSRDPVVVADAMTPYGFRMMSRELAGSFADMVVAQ